MRSDESFLLDMIIAAQNIREFTVGLTQEQFEASKLHKSAVIREMQVMGEAARSISQEMKWLTLKLHGHKLLECETG
ncbi:MAG: DUF86 domain-containing protein [Chloroflexi bacterium]|nr:DUF86 domain-containing protein [Chloroflexota bacterium]